LDNEKSLKNLEKRKSFSTDNVAFALDCQKKSVEKRKENKLLKEVAAEKLLKKFNGVSFQDLTLDKLLDYCKKEGAEPETVLKILTFLRDTSGQKPKEEVQAVCMPIINIKGL
jgi:hypothetical protein